MKAAGPTDWGGYSRIHEYKCTKESPADKLARLQQAKDMLPNQQAIFSQVNSVACQRHVSEAKAIAVGSKM